MFRIIRHKLIKLLAGTDTIIINARFESAQ